MRAGFGYYRAIPQDIADNQAIATSFKLPMPVLALGGDQSWGRRMEVVESLELQPRPEVTQEKAKPNELEAEAKKKLESLTPKEAEERYNYLLGKSVSELTDAEFEERLVLAQRGSGKAKGPK